MSPTEKAHLEYAIQQHLDRKEPDLVEAYAEFAADKLEIPVPLVAALIPDMVLSYRWEALRSVIGRSSPDLAEQLGELVMGIDKLRMAFIEHEAERRRKEAEEIKHGRAA